MHASCLQTVVATCSMRSRMWLHLVCVTAAMAAMAVCGPAPASDIYRWVDAQGRMQMSDRPPAMFPGQVIKQDAGRDEVAPAQRKAAQDRAERDRARLKSMEADREQAAAQSPPKPRTAASSGFADESDPSLPWRASAEDCRMWRQEYRRNAACFAPFRFRGGGIKPEAFSVCGPVLVDPEFECAVGAGESPMALLRVGALL